MYAQKPCKLPAFSGSGLSGALENSRLYVFRGYVSLYIYIYSTSRLYSTAVPIYILLSSMRVLKIWCSDVFLAVVDHLNYVLVVRAVLLWCCHVVVSLLCYNVVVSVLRRSVLCSVVWLLRDWFYQQLVPNLLLLKNILPAACCCSQFCKFS